MIDEESKDKKIKAACMHPVFVVHPSNGILSSIDQWGGQLKTTKREIRDYMILEL